MDASAALRNSEPDSRRLPTPIEVHLAAGRARYLDFVRRRVNDSELAEDLLQDAVLRGIEAAPDIADAERMSAWFHRVLRNAIVDYYRRQHVRRRRTVALADDADVPEAPPDYEPELCECFRELIPTLKPEYGAVLLRMDLADADPVTVAAELGITLNNLKVRRHRARQALRERLLASCRLCAEHGCLDCTCRVNAAGV